ncbi:hypothetical protein DPMN_078376 [Dreissena polymorpha]|uniref:Uncharacterized protein n=1 Tax=Dreissena polymorpha TaxID=45954 RepID=A0A9D3YM53_DREPO|nr:hypothetical protein DPMN_078376 [Dreissena polymorpha]
MTDRLCHRFEKILIVLFQTWRRCTHIAGLLFALEGRPQSDEIEDAACTSKPCQWNQSSKKKKKQPGQSMK